METTFTVPFQYNGLNFTAYLVELFDDEGRSHTEIDCIVDDDTAEEVKDRHVYDFFFDSYCPD